LSSEEDHPAAESQRRAPTIDLQAREIEPEAQHQQADKPEAADVKADDVKPDGVKADDVKTEEAAMATSSQPGVMRSILPMTGAGLVGGLIGAATIALGPMLAPPAHNDRAVLSRVSAVEQQMRELAARVGTAGADIDELTSRLAKLESALAARQGGPDTDLTNRLSSMEGEIKALAESVSIAQRRTDESLALARQGAEQAGTATAGLDKLSQRIAGVEQELAKRIPAQPVDRPARLLVAATALVAPLQRGEPFGPELSALRALGANSQELAPLEPFAATGLPNAQALGRELSALVPAMLAASGTPAHEGFLQKLQANAERLVRIQRIEEVQGNDVGAVLSRIAGDAERGDVSAALAELGKLPPQVRAPAEAWIKKAQAREGALASARALRTEALAGLSK
jgi:hypothetical protein